ncbi:MAG: helix-turn-helix domain-containing protein [Lentisphaerae bacterium]|nr:helix-turn-helix domain-containing protein [Lentisphaerota bacterium]MCP4101054.1 helix-turn-helix domain-containing protein [Lentisphaerota bacterium]
MLAVVKKPHIEITLKGEGANEIIGWISQKYEVSILEDDAPADNEQFVDIKETEWWQNNKHRVITGARHKINMTQNELAAQSGFRQSVISEYENGKRPLTLKAALKLAKVLETTPEHLLT